MKRVFRTTMMALLVMILLVGMMAPAAMAYGTVSKDMTVTVYMKSSHENGDVPESDKIPVTVTPIEGTEGSKQEYDVECDGSEGYGSTDITFGPYSKPGIHKYGVTIGNSSQQDRVIEDEQKHYVVIITAINAENDAGLELNVAIRNADLVDGDYDYDKTTTNKPQYLDAEKIYAATRTITVTKRWPDGGKQSVEVYLYEQNDDNEDGKIDKEKERHQINKVTLNSANEWKHTFTGLDSRKDYSLDEKDVAGFHESYKYDKTTDPLNWTVTITNSKSLYQTGQLNWPIPVLVCMGSMLMLAGVVMLRRKEEQADE